MSESPHLSLRSFSLLPWCNAVSFDVLRKEFGFRNRALSIIERVVNQKKDPYTLRTIILLLSGLALCNRRVRLGAHYYCSYGIQGRVRRNKVLPPRHNFQWRSSGPVSEPNQKHLYEVPTLPNRTSQQITRTDNNCSATTIALSSRLLTRFSPGQ